jgi:hypothetical protein
MERVLLKVKRVAGDNFSRFQPWSAAQATIAIGMPLINSRI